MLLILTAFSLKLLIAGPRIDIAICKPDGVTESIISSARLQTERVFRPIRVYVVWRACDTSIGFVSQARAPVLIVRLWKDKLPKTVGDTSLDVMGDAFVEGHDGGMVADVYLRAILAAAEQHYADPRVMLGFVVAHELGHLLLGPSHAPGGIMQAVWGQKEFDALRQRRLRFTSKNAERIRHILAVRTAENMRRAWGYAWP